MADFQPDQNWAGWRLKTLCPRFNRFSFKWQPQLDLSNSTSSCLRISNNQLRKCSIALSDHSLVKGRSFSSSTVYSYFSLISIPFFKLDAACFRKITKHFFSLLFHIISHKVIVFVSYSSAPITLLPSNFNIWMANSFNASWHLYPILLVVWFLLIDSSVAAKRCDAQQNGQSVVIGKQIKFVKLNKILISIKTFNQKCQFLAGVPYQMRFADFSGKTLGHCDSSSLLLSSSFAAWSSTAINQWFSRNTIYSWFFSSSTNLFAAGRKSSFLNVCW